MNTVSVSVSIRERIAVAVSAAILLITVVYWIKQIADAMAMLRLAHGG